MGEPPVDDYRECPCCGGMGYTFSHKKTDCEQRIEELVAAVKESDVRVASMQQDYEREYNRGTQRGHEAQALEVERNKLRRQFEDAARIGTQNLERAQRAECEVARLCRMIAVLRGDVAVLVAALQKAIKDAESEGYSICYADRALALARGGE